MFGVAVQEIHQNSKKWLLSLREDCGTLTDWDIRYYNFLRCYLWSLNFISGAWRPYKIRKLLSENDVEVASSTSVVMAMVPMLQGAHLTITVDKTRQGPVIAPFSVQRTTRCLSNQPFLLLLMIYFWYNTQGAFVIIILICSNLLNCLKAVKEQ